MNAEGYKDTRLSCEDLRCCPRSGCPPTHIHEKEGARGGGREGARVGGNVVQVVDMWA